MPEGNAVKISVDAISQTPSIPRRLYAPATFQRLIDKVISPELEPHAFDYLDDFITVSETSKITSNG